MSDYHDRQARRGTVGVFLLLKVAAVFVVIQLVHWLCHLTGAL